jgi:hypothetical protein
MLAEKKQMIMPCRSMRDSRAEWFHTFASVRLSTYGPTGLVVKRKPEACARGHYNAVFSDSSFVLDGKRQAPVNINRGCSDELMDPMVSLRPGAANGA